MKPMELKDKIIIGLLSVFVVSFLFSINGNKLTGFGAYDESYTNYTNLKATDSFISEGTSLLTGLTTLTAGVSGDLKAVDGVATTTMAVGSSASVLNRGKACLWNGASYTILEFPINSTATTSWATSTTCQ